MSTFLDALSQKASSTPIWFMRQVGRYMPEYQRLKKNRDLFSIFHDEETIVQATLLGPQILQTDAAIIFADILSILDGFNIPYKFSPGPVINFSTEKPLTFTEDPKETFSYLYKAISELKRSLKVPLIGFSASPFTLASYLLEGGSSKDFNKAAKTWYEQPEFFLTLMKTLSSAIVSYLEGQVRAGVDVIQLFDSTSHRLPKDLFQKYVIEINTKLIEKLQHLKVPVVLFCRNSSFFIDSLKQTGATALSIDWHKPIEEVLTENDKNISYQGNIDPALLLLPKQDLLRFFAPQFQKIKNFPNYILNTGHGILPETPLENVLALIDYVRNQF
ncbi:uroporphyrinogen decarboxylase [Chlamydiifrater phoenicopteri]|uniref:uroporphyrinogen decarboxylase n=1 Tax=Chlamydiifrater phoenicopteri TaxID=2681469 RepID=UPI001BCD8315|nr:uroporphyrinogen decarboxylase [Chlamydiifrater phoenicopteri]